MKTVRNFILRSPARFALCVFFVLICAVTSFLMLPLASVSGETPLYIAFFTAVSSICVTGLSVVDISQHFSSFGHGVILISAEFGGIGVVTLAVFLGRVATGRIGIKQKNLVAAESANELIKIRSVFFVSIIISIVVEALLCLMFFIYYGGFAESADNALYKSIYMAVSSFCNLGFVPEPINSVYIGFVVIIGVFLGSLGYPVLINIVKKLFSFFKKGSQKYKFDLHSKLTLIMSFVLSGAASVMFCIFGGLDAFHSIFLSFMTKSGGFYDALYLNESAKLIAIVFMFIGGGSASCAGGIKVTTFFVLILSLISEAKGYRNLQIFKKCISYSVLRLAVSVILSASAIVIFASLLIAPFSAHSLLDIIFEVVSAFGTCGLSSGVSSDATPFVAYILSIVMCLGRIGVITLISLIAVKKSPNNYWTPAQNIYIG